MEIIFYYPSLRRNRRVAYIGVIDFCHTVIWEPNQSTIEKSPVNSLPRGETTSNIRWVNDILGSLKSLLFMSTFHGIKCTVYLHEVA